VRWIDFTALYVNYTLVAQDRLRDHKCAMWAEITVW